MNFSAHNTCEALSRSLGGKLCEALTTGESRGGFYHDGRFDTLMDVEEHYDRFLKTRLTEQEKKSSN